MPCPDVSMWAGYINVYSEFGGDGGIIFGESPCRDPCRDIP